MRPATVHVLEHGDLGHHSVLVCRAEGSEAQSMAIRALEVDAGWTHDRAVQAILKAEVIPGRWFKTPDRDEPFRWVLVKAKQNKPMAGATPGVLYKWEDQA